MDPNSPFAGKDVPIIGQPKILDVTAVVLMQCNCENKALLMGTVGPQPLMCGACKKAWLVEAQIEIGARQVVRSAKEAEKLVTE